MDGSRNCIIVSSVAEQEFAIFKALASLLIQFSLEILPLSDHSILTVALTHAEFDLIDLPVRIRNAMHPSSPVMVYLDATFLRYTMFKLRSFQ